MKLLMVTRKVDAKDALAGFTLGWVNEIAKNVDTLNVLTWQKSSPEGLLDNVKLYSLTGSKFSKVIKAWFYLFKNLSKVDGVFCHMNPEYTIITAPIAKLFRKRVVSWYTHRAVSFRRRMVEILANEIVTANSTSFRDPKYPKKVKVIGHGIDTKFFVPGDQAKEKGVFRILTVGRISPTKDYESIIKAVAELNNKNVQLQIVGDVILDYQKKYLENLKKMVTSLKLDNQVDFIGWVANSDIVPYYQKADLFINMSGTGSVDKVVLEAMACQCMVLTSNVAFREILLPELMIDKNDYKMLARKINWVVDLDDLEYRTITSNLRSEVVNNHNLVVLARRITEQFNEK